MGAITQKELPVIITEEMLTRVHSEPLEVACEACKIIVSEGLRLPDEDLLEVVIFLRTLIEEELISYEGSVPAIDNGKVQKASASNFAANIHSQAQKTIERNKAKAAEQAHISRFKLIIGKGFSYEFTDGDINRVQELISELRKELANEPRLDEGHKRRLLIRLEQLQRELHKKVSDLSHFYNLMGDFGVAIGKLGRDAKPFTDRIKEIVQIGWKSQARAEQLPSNAENPMLEHDEEPPKLD